MFEIIFTLLLLVLLPLGSPLCPIELTIGISAPSRSSPPFAIDRLLEDVHSTMNLSISFKERVLGMSFEWRRRESLGGWRR